MAVTADLLVIVPSRGRPHHIAALWDAWQGAATELASLLVAVDDDDPTLDDYRDVCARSDIELTVGPRLRLGGTLNKVALERCAHHFALAFLGDDHRPMSAGWDKAFLDELHRLGTGMVYGNDQLRSEDLPTAIAMTSDIVQALGYMVPAGLTHLWIDNTWLDLGKAVDRITYLPDVIVEHLHPAIGKGEWDAGYVECNSEAQLESDREKYRAWLEDGIERDASKLKALL